MTTPKAQNALYRAEKPFNLQESSTKHFVNGLIKIKSKLTKLRQDNECTINKACLSLLVAYLILRKGKKLSTAVSAQKSSFLIWKDKLQTYEPNIQTTSLFQILLRELISKEKGCRPYWNSQCRTVLKNLWLPTKIGCADSALTSYSSFSNLQIQNSLFSTQTVIPSDNQPNKNYQKTCCQLFTSTPANKWENEDIKVKNRKIQLNPTPQQKQVLLEWMATSRYVYNKTVQAIQQGHRINFYELRNKLVTLKNNQANIKDWEEYTPKEIRAQAVNDVCKAFKTAFANLAIGNIDHFDIGFRKKKNTEDKTMFIQKQAIKLQSGKVSIYDTELGSFELNKRTQTRNSNLVVQHDCRLGHKKGKFFLYVPVSLKYQASSPDIAIHKTFSKSRLCGIDPGVRSFMTVYDGQSLTEMPLGNKLETLRVKLNLLLKLKKPRQTVNKVRSRIYNLVEDMHWKTANFITNSYDWIFFGKLDSQECQKQSNNAVLNQKLSLIRPYEFRQKLRYKAICKNKKLFITPEHFTTKGCCWCGNINQNVGSKTEYRCTECKAHLGRDINASINMLLKGLSMFTNATKMLSSQVR